MTCGLPSRRDGVATRRCLVLLGLLMHTLTLTKLPGHLLRCHRILLPWACTLPLPGYRGDGPPEAGHQHKLLTAIGEELWYCGDEMLTAGSYLGDEGWSNRGESPATLGAVGISMRNSADALLAADWANARGELQVAAAASDYYFNEKDMLNLLSVFPEDEEEDGPVWGDGLATASAQQSLAQLSQELTDLSGRVGVGTNAGQALRRAAENLRRLRTSLSGRPPWSH